MTLDKMKLAVCKKLPELIGQNFEGKLCWKSKEHADDWSIINWPTEGLQVCHEAEKIIDQMPVDSKSLWLDTLAVCCEWPKAENALQLRFAVQYISTRATYEQRLEALCRVWFPERFQ